MLDLFSEAVFRDNLALSLFLGLCMFLGVSQRVETALGMGIVVLIVQTVTVPLNFLILTYLLEKGALSWAGLPDLDLTFLALISFVGVIAAMVQILEMFVDRFFPKLYHALGSFLPLVTVNCAILGGSLFMQARQYSFGQSAVYGVGSGFGWLLAITGFAAMRERLKTAEVPHGLNGVGISFILAGLMSLGFASFTGMSLR